MNESETSNIKRGFKETMREWRAAGVFDESKKGVPEYLKENAVWCAWKFVERDGKPTKKPFNPHTGYGADPTNPATFADYETARKFAAVGKYEGVGVGVFGDLAGIDIDHCIIDGELSEMAQYIVDAMDTYTEISPSGTGLRLFFLAPGYSYDSDVYYINNKRAGEKSGYGGEGLEIYVAGMTEKYMTVTGNALNSRGIEERADRLQPILEKFMRRDAGKANTPKNTAPAMPNDLDDFELLERAFNSQNGEKARRLYDGDMSDYGNDHSAADLALCNILAFWTGRDARRMDSIFRQSALFRDKWDSRRGDSTYGADTIQKAIDSCIEVYTPGGNTGGNASAEAGEGAQEDETAQNEQAQSFIDTADIAAAIYDCEGYEEPVATGLVQLDLATNGGLRSGLTVIGATSSAGKTTLCVQIADYIAAGGRPVLFVTIEQSGRELVSKSLSRLMAKRGYKAVPAWAMNSPHERERWSEGKAAALLESLEEYMANIAPNIFYLSSNEQPTVSQIETRAKIIQGKCGAAPVIVVDYLQLLAPKDERDTDKRAADYNVSQLRRMARDMRTPIIAISSLNRASYSGSIELSSFKESGGIEYASDLLLGLQPYNMEADLNNVSGGEDGRKKKAKEITNKFKREKVRRCEIIVLKNRNGAIPPAPLPVTFDCASNLFIDGIEDEEPAQRHFTVL